MSYKSQHLIRQIRQARETLGLSQRALSGKTGQTQSHISQIEGGKMEPGLASFIEMARALDLEVMLVPRKFVPSVSALVKPQTTTSCASFEPRPAYTLDNGDDHA